VEARGGLRVHRARRRGREVRCVARQEFLKVMAGRELRFLDSSGK
jgi:hypothetical protein